MPVISNDKPPRLVGGSRSQVDVGGCGRLSNRAINVKNRTAETFRHIAALGA